MIDKLVKLDELTAKEQIEMYEALKDKLPESYKIIDNAYGKEALKKTILEVSVIFSKINFIQYEFPNDFDKQVIELEKLEDRLLCL